MVNSHFKSEMMTAGDQQYVGIYMGAMSLINMMDLKHRYVQNLVTDKELKHLLLEVEYQITQFICQQFNQDIKVVMFTADQRRKQQTNWVGQLPACYIILPGHISATKLSFSYQG